MIYLKLWTAQLTIENATIQFSIFFLLLQFLSDTKKNVSHYRFAGKQVTFKIESGVTFELIKISSDMNSNDRMLKDQV